MEKVEETTKLFNIIFKSKVERIKNIMVYTTYYNSPVRKNIANK